MLAKIHSVALVGLNIEKVEVEVDLSGGLPAFTIVGLPDKAVDESKERVRSALKNSAATFPQKRITVNLAPADLRKEGPAYDLPIAIGLLLASEQIIFDPVKTLFVGELSLEGKLRHTSGILSIAIASKELGYETIVIPAANAPEASTVDGITIYAAESLIDIINHYRNEVPMTATSYTPYVEADCADSLVDFSQIAGQEQAKRALEIAAAGGHNLIMNGPPGSGKTLLAKTFCSILPPLKYAEALEVTKIYSVAGVLKSNSSLVKQRPFRSPHHTTSAIALIGGGSWPRPGEISLSHRGVLFLDELPEFPRAVLEVLRQPLEEGSVTISRANSALSFPAKFILVAAQNPCPCGYYRDTERQCTCSLGQILKYQKKISGPLLDRIDIHLELPRVDYRKLSAENRSEASSVIAARVKIARQIQLQRFVDQNIITNSEMSIPEINKYCKLTNSNADFLRSACKQLGLSARGYHRILKLSRTIADLEGSIEIEARHLAEAMQYRSKSRFVA